MANNYGGEYQRVGILENPEDPFAQDLASRLGVAEFLTLGKEMIVPSGQFRVIVDRASYLYPYLREALKVLSINGCYVINNPFASSMTNKLIDYHLCHQLDIPVPRTLVLPDLTVLEEFPDSVAEPSWERVSQEINFPCILKPFDGYGWVNVFEVQNLEELKDLHSSKGYEHIFLVQQLIRYTHYYRVFCIGQKEVFFTQWVPRYLGAGEYSLCDPKPIEHLKDRLIGMTVELNAALDLDINVLEWCLDQEGKPWLIDAFNEVPDIQKQRLPEDCYRWLLDTITTCIQDKLNDHEKRNRVIFRLPFPATQW